MQEEKKSVLVKLRLSASDSTSEQRPLQKADTTAASLQAGNSNLSTAQQAPGMDQKPFSHAAGERTTANAADAAVDAVASRRQSHSGLPVNCSLIAGFHSRGLPIPSQQTALSAYSRRLPLNVCRYLQGNWALSHMH